MGSRDEQTRNDCRSWWNRIGRCVPAQIIVTLVLLISCSDRLGAQSRRPTEYEVKAAYLYNFGKFVRWPAGTLNSDAFHICVLGHDPFGGALNSIIQGEKLNGKPLQIHRVENTDETENCQILFISTSEDRRLDAILSGVSKRPVLTVSDIPEFVNRGGDIEFVNQGDKIRFKVNLGSATNAGLVLSSELLKVAVSVKGNGQSGEGM